MNVSLSKILKTTTKHLQSLREIGVETLADLLNYFPRRYVDFSQMKKIAQLGENDFETAAGEIRNLRTVPTRTGRTLVTAQLCDETGQIKLVWFNALWVIRNLRNGNKIALTGKLQIGQYGERSLVSGTFEKMTGEMVHAGRIVPIYRQRGKLITTKWLREKIFPLLNFAKDLPDELPQEIQQRHDLLPLDKAISQIHFPDSFESLELARKRLAFEELFFLQLAGLKRKLDWQKSASGSAQEIFHTAELIAEFEAKLPFKFTAAQKRVRQEIINDLAKNTPANRLLEGDVGSGKTVVAALAIFLTARAKQQAALLAPTEILAAQHFRNFLKLLHPLGVRAELLTGSTTAKNKKEICAKLKNGELNLIVGTHALLQTKIKFHSLALAVIDEQHRFGVEQRTLLKKDFAPHFLSLTATPIPRTLALTIFGDQDISVIDELPPGRQKVLTRIVPPKKRQDAYHWIESEVQKGRQVFIVCPLVEESETLEVRSAKKEFERLQSEVFQNFTMGLLHGKLRSKEKDAVMSDFAAGKIQILVATTVVEVGIDVPNASIMLIEGAERFGLAQLHQLRGRVGRGKYASYCFLFSDSESTVALARLHALEKITNGFELAEIDLRLRGPGEVFGTRQSGVPDLKVARLTDVELIKVSREEAERVLKL
jgi:ATP-dependent DNA helicase RecG